MIDTAAAGRQDECKGHPSRIDALSRVPHIRRATARRMRSHSRCTIHPSSLIVTLDFTEDWTRGVTDELLDSRRAAGLSTSWGGGARYSPWQRRKRNTSAYALLRRGDCTADRPADTRDTVDYRSAVQANALLQDRGYSARQKGTGLVETTRPASERIPIILPHALQACLHGLERCHWEDICVHTCK